MHNLPFTSPAAVLAGLVTVCLCSAAIPAQTAPTQSAPVAHKPAAPAQPASKVANPAELLAKANNLYYSYAKDGLEGFECTVHPDWKQIVLLANKDVPGAADEAEVKLLNRVKVTMHAHLAGESTLDWDQPPAGNAATGSDADSGDAADLLNGMHQTTQQTLLGFIQFWMPFINGSIVPNSSRGLEITQSAKGYRIVASQGGSTVTERFDSNLMLQNFHVAMEGMKVSFDPAYTTTEKGLLVSSFTSNIELPGTESAPKPAAGPEMKVAIEYQTVDGFPVPASLSMEKVNAGTFSFAFDGCKVNRFPK